MTIEGSRRFEPVSELRVAHSITSWQNRYGTINETSQAHAGRARVEAALPIIC